MQAKITLKIEKKTFTKLQPSTIYSMTTKRPFIIEVFHVERRSILHIQTNTSGIIKKKDVHAHMLTFTKNTHTHTFARETRKTVITCNDNDDEDAAINGR